MTSCSSIGQPSLLAAGTSDAGLQVVRDQDFRRAPDELEGAQGADPIGEALRPGGLGVGVTAGPEDRDEDGGGAHFAGGRVVNRDRVAGVVHEEFLAGSMLVTEYHVLTLQP